MKKQEIYLIYFLLFIVIVYILFFNRKISENFQININNYQEINKLTVNQIYKIPLDVISTIPANIIPQINAKFFNTLKPDQIKKLTSAQMKNLTKDQINKINKEFFNTLNINIFNNNVNISLSLIKKKITPNVTKSDKKVAQAQLPLPVVQPILVLPAPPAVPSPSAVQPPSPSAVPPLPVIETTNSNVTLFNQSTDIQNIQATFFNDIPDDKIKDLDANKILQLSDNTINNSPKLNWLNFSDDQKNILNKSYRFVKLLYNKKKGCPWDISQCSGTRGPWEPVDEGTVPVSNGQYTNAQIEQLEKSFFNKSINDIKCYTGPNIDDLKDNDHAEYIPQEPCYCSFCTY